MTDTTTPPPAETVTTPSASSTPAAQTPPADPNAVPPGGGQPQPAPAAADPKPEEKQLLFSDGEKPVEKKEGDDKPGEEKPGEKKDGEGDEPAPLKIEDFTIPEGYEIAPEVATQLTDIINNKDLSQKDQVQKLLELHTDILKKQSDDFAAFRTEQRKLTENDPVLGGENLQKTIASANEAVRAFALDPKLGGDQKTFDGFVERLTILGLGDDPHVIRFLNNVSNFYKKATSEDGFSGSSTTQSGPKPIEDILWGKK